VACLRDTALDGVDGLGLLGRLLVLDSFDRLVDRSDVGPLGELVVTLDDNTEHCATFEFK
jgi:hypothetical protein